MSNNSAHTVTALAVPDRCTTRAAIVAVLRRSPGATGSQVADYLVGQGLCSRIVAHTELCKLRQAGIVYHAGPRRRAYRWYLRDGVTVVEAPTLGDRVLAHIEAHPGCTAGELVQMLRAADVTTLGGARQAVSRFTRIYVALGWIRRTPERIGYRCYPL